MANYLAVDRTIYKTNGAIDRVEARYWGYAASLTCTEAEVAFRALSGQAKLDQTTTTAPIPATGKHWDSRDCSGGGSVNPTYCVVSRDDFTPYPDEPTTPQNYDSDGVLGGYYTV